MFDHAEVLEQVRATISSAIDVFVLPDNQLTVCARAARRVLGRCRPTRPEHVHYVAAVTLITIARKHPCAARSCHTLTPARMASTCRSHRPTPVIMWAAAGSLAPAADLLPLVHAVRPAPPARRPPRQRAHVVAAAAPEVESSQKNRKGRRASSRQSGNAFTGPSRPKRGGAPRKEEDEEEDEEVYNDDEEVVEEEQVDAEAAAKNEQKLERTSSRLAVAAKISAARALARKLADEKAAAAAAAKMGGGAVNTAVEACVWAIFACSLIVSPITPRIKKSAEAASAFAAQEVARADTMARAAKRAEVSASQMMEFQKLKVACHCALPSTMSPRDNHSGGERSTATIGARGGTGQGQCTV